MTNRTGFWMVIPSMIPSTLLAAVLGTRWFVENATAQTTTPSPAACLALPSETPDKFEPATNTFDSIKRDVMISIRAAVKRAFGAIGPLPRKPSFQGRHRVIPQALNGGAR